MVSQQVVLPFTDWQLVDPPLEHNVAPLTEEQLIDSARSGAARNTERRASGSTKASLNMATSTALSCKA